MDIAEMFEAFSDQLTCYATGISRDRDLAEDLVSETFGRALRNRELLQMLPDYKVRSWLYRVLKNIFIDQRRRAVLEAAFYEDSEAYESDGFEKMEYRQFLEILPDALREVIVKKYWLNMNSSEIAESLSIPASTVRFRLSRALGLLRKNLE
ncbi:MAG: RNA polymerase sigma factor [Candidatus Wallbacteria bacterium]|nr:RNA polymerase sigma factor [Candidatus Wallbacteria bacterium]